MSDTKDAGFFAQTFEQALGTYTVDDEYPRAATRTEKPHYTLTETQYFGFTVPDAHLQCFMWTWYHPNLNLVSGGVMGWKGVKKFNISCELVDFRNCMSGDAVANFTDYKLDSGLSVQMTRPSQEFRLRYDDPALGNSFDVVQTAVGDPLMWPGNKHFEQIMRCRGTITLRGESHDVDCFTMRDRSYGEYRAEAALAIPPNTWASATFGEDFAFCVVGMEDVGLNPIWKGKFEVAPESTLRFGWMIVDGERITISKVRMKLDYDANLLPSRIYLLMTDSRGRDHEAVGETYAATWFSPWLNARMPICAVRWRCDGREATGEVQSLQFTEFVRTYS